MSRTDKQITTDTSPVPAPNPAIIAVTTGTTPGETRYDGAAINERWGNAWPSTISDVTDDAHAFSPVLQAPVANLLGKPWYLESGSPGGDFVTWLDLPTGGRVGVSPHLAEDKTMRWVIGREDSAGNDLGQEHDLAITEEPEVVAARVRALMATWGITDSCF